MLATASCCVGLVASPGKTGGRLGVEFGVMEQFKTRATEIIRKSRDPARCLQLMRDKASSILGFGVLPGRTVCSSPEFALPPQRAMAATGDGVQNRRSSGTAGTVKAAATVFVPASTRLAAPVVDAPGRASLTEFDAQGTEVLVQLGATDEVAGVGLDVQAPVQLCSTALCHSDLMPGIQENLDNFQGLVCLEAGFNTVYVRPNYNQSSKTNELVCNDAGEFRDMEISCICFVHGVSVEEDPDPGGLWILRKISAAQKEEVNSTDPSDMAGAVVLVAQPKCDAHLSGTLTVPLSSPPKHDPKRTRTGNKKSTTCSCKAGSLEGRRQGQ